MPEFGQLRPGNDQTRAILAEVCPTWAEFRGDSHVEPRLMRRKRISRRPIAGGYVHGPPEGCSAGHSSEDGRSGLGFGFRPRFGLRSRCSRSRHDPDRRATSRVGSAARLASHGDPDGGPQREMGSPQDRHHGGHASRLGPALPRIHTHWGTGWVRVVASSTSSAQRTFR